MDDIKAREKKPLIILKNRSAKQTCGYQCVVGSSLKRNQDIFVTQGVPAVLKL